MSPLDTRISIPEVWVPLWGADSRSGSSSYSCVTSAALLTFSEPPCSYLLKKNGCISASIGLLELTQVSYGTIRNPMFEIIITLNLEHWVKVRSKGRRGIGRTALGMYGGLVGCWVWQKAGDPWEAGFPPYHSPLRSVALCQLCSHSGAVGLFIPLSQGTSASHAFSARGKSWS